MLLVVVGYFAEAVDQLDTSGHYLAYLNRCAIMQCMVVIGRESQIMKGVLDLCVMSILDAEPTYGYGLVSALADRGLDLVAEGSIYPLLARLERRGLLSSFKSPSAEGPARKYYELTVEGRAELVLGRQSWSETTAKINRLLEVHDETASA